MRDLLNLIFWLIIIGALVGGIQISQDPEKMGAAFREGDEVTITVTQDDKIDGVVTGYFVVKVRWSDEEKWRYETFGVRYKDDAGEIESINCKPALLAKTEKTLELYEFEQGDTTLTETDEYVKSLIEGTN